MKNNRGLEMIRTTGVVAILRAHSSEGLIQAAAALQAGGVKAIEVTLTTPGALAVIAQARAHFGEDVFFGAGSVLDAETARQAILAGAQFIVAPSTKTETIQLCRRYSIPVFPGAFTATEIVTAWESGADMVKIFPASVGGPGLIKALKAPLPQVEMMAVGGVEIENTAEFIRAGASGVGVGGSLVNDSLLKQGNYAEITRRAAAFIEAVQTGRA